MMNLCIGVQGDMFDAIVIDYAQSSCGNIRDGVAFHLFNRDKPQQDAGGVLDWAAFEAAYLALKAARTAALAGPPNGEERPNE